MYGKDIRTDQEVIRKNMGVCMQHDVLFNYLTTKEHLLLYGYIKVPHCSKQELYQEVKRYKISRAGERREAVKIVMWWCQCPCKAQNHGLEVLLQLQLRVQMVPCSD